MRPVLQGQGLGFPLQGQRRPLRRAENKGCGADVWAQPELLQGGPQSPVPSRCPYLRGQGRHAQPSRRANTRSQHQVHQGPGCLLCAARTMTHRAGGGGGRTEWSGRVHCNRRAGGGGAKQAVDTRLQEAGGVAEPRAPTTATAGGGSAGTTYPARGSSSERARVGWSPAWPGVQRTYSCRL